MESPETTLTNKTMIIGKIDVSKIDKSKLFKGSKGTYLDIVLIDTPGNQYGDFMICQGLTKEDRAAGQKGAILGNGKVIGGSKSAPKSSDHDDDVPW